MIDYQIIRSYSIEMSGEKQFWRTSIDKIRTIIVLSGFAISGNIRIHHMLFYFPLIYCNIYVNLINEDEAIYL